MQITESFMKDPGNPGVSLPEVCIFSILSPWLESVDTENKVKPVKDLHSNT